MQPTVLQAASTGASSSAIGLALGEVVSVQPAVNPDN